MFVKTEPGASGIFFGGGGCSLGRSRISSDLSAFPVQPGVLARLGSPRMDDTFQRCLKGSGGAAALVQCSDALRTPAARAFVEPTASL